MNIIINYLIGEYMCNYFILNLIIYMSLPKINMNLYNINSSENFRKHLNN